MVWCLRLAPVAVLEVRWEAFGPVLLHRLVVACSGAGGEESGVLFRSKAGSFEFASGAVVLRRPASSSCGLAMAEGDDFPAASLPADRSKASSAVPGGSSDAGAAARLPPAFKVAVRRLSKVRVVIFVCFGVCCIIVLR